MIMYFCIYAILGYFMESCYVSLFQRKFISSGLLYGPYIPLYGIGAIALIYISPFIANSLYLTIIIGGITMTVIEYFASLYIEKVFHTNCWDYSHHFCQFQGRICLIYFIIWCLLSYLFIFYIHPFIICLIPYNDFTLIMSLLFILIVVKDTIKKLNVQRNNGIIV